MAGFTAQVTQGYKTSGLSVTSVTDTYTGDGEVNEDVSVPASTTDMEVDTNIIISQIKSMVLMGDQALTVKTNSTTSPGVTIVLAAKKQVQWNTDHLEANPLGTGTVTKMYVTNGTTSTARFQFSALKDSTP